MSFSPERKPESDPLPVEFRDKELIPGSPEEEHRIVDLLAAIPDSNGRCAFLVHVEIERKAPKNIGRRLWDYSIHLRGHHPEPLVSLVVFLRGGPPGAVWQTHVEETAGLEVARFRYLSFGLSRLPADQLLARPEPLAWGLSALAKRRGLGRARLKFEALQKIAGAQISEHQRFLLMNCVLTYLPLKGRDAEEYASLAGAQKSPEIQAMQMTWAEKMEAKGIEKGIEKGIAKGIATGIARGMARGREEGLERGADQLRRLVLLHLNQRFGKVSAPLRRRLAAIRSLDDLGAIADRIFVVQTIEELGLGA